MNENKQKGLITELQCQTAFTQLGYNVSIPLGEDCRYDMIVDVEGKLIRVQVKTCHLNKTESGIEFATRSVQGGNTSHSVQTKRYDVNDIDYFATFWDNKCYLIKVDDCQGVSRLLSFETKKVNKADTYFIENYEIEQTLYRLINNLPEPKVKMKIFQYDKEHNLIASYETAKEAAQAVNGDNSHICQVLKGERKTAYGYIWERRFV